MCGLFGAILRDKGDIEKARRVRDVLTHRGPDQAGEFLHFPVYIGHRRLSILDLSEAGRQPMISDDGKVAIAVNGEIYNFMALRRELESAGYVFRSRSDSEVVLHGYRHWGLEGLARRVDGMIAAVIYDDAEKTVHAFRDRAGIKPLFYHHDGNSFAWASELKALQHWLPAEKKTVDNTALYDFLIYRYIPAPKSLYRNIFKLPLAHMLSFRVKDGALSVKPYWNFQVSERNDPHEKLAEELAALLRDSVRAQLVADVPVGFFLSGGLDSSIIAHHAVETGGDTQAFSIGFDDRTHDETDYARLMAKHLDLRHIVKTLSREETENIFERMRLWYDEPFSDTSAVPTFRVCELARQSVTVSLSGDGGDELFGGYKWYDTFAKIKRAQKFLIPVKKYGNGFSGRLSRLSIRDPLELYTVIRSGLPWHERKKYRTRFNIPQDYDDHWHFRAHWNPAYGLRKSLQVLDFHTYLPNNIFTKIDRLSMAVSLEARVPFLSNALIDFSFSLPESFIYKGGMLKGGLKSAYRGVLPDAIIDRPKKGFSMPVNSWKKGSLGSHKTFQEAVLSDFGKAGVI